MLIFFTSFQHLKYIYSKMNLRIIVFEICTLYLTLIATEDTEPELPGSSSEDYTLLQRGPGFNSINNANPVKENPGDTNNVKPASDNTENAPKAANKQYNSGCNQMPLIIASEDQVPLIGRHYENVVVHIEDGVEENSDMMRENMTILHQLQASIFRRKHRNFAPMAGEYF